MGVILLCAVLAAGMITFRKVARWVNPYSDLEISGPLLLTSDWLEIKPTTPLTLERPVQEIVLEMDKTIRVDVDTWQLVLPDGSLATTEAQLVDQSGNTYALLPRSAAKSNVTQIWSQGFGIAIKSSRSSPSNTVFTSVRLRSDRPFPCARILWRTYDPKDLK